MKDHKEKYLKIECEKVARVLEAWKEDPKQSRKELGVVPWNEWDDVNEPLTERELQSLQNFIKKYGVGSYRDFSGIFISIFNTSDLFKIRIVFSVRARMLSSFILSTIAPRIGSLSSSVK